MNELDSLSIALAGAPDERIRRAVAVVDTMTVRGEADGLIAPLRTRLARIRPIRPLSFTRLLFIPLDPAIVATSLWESGSAGVPRTALAVLARMLRDEWPDIAAVEAALRCRTTDDLAFILERGATIWPQAAARLRQAATPAYWQSTTGLTDTEYVMIARAAATVLLHSPACLSLGDADAAEFDADLAALCRRAVDDAARLTAERPDLPPDPAPLATLLAVTMLRSDRPDRVLAIAEAAGGGQRQPLISTQLALEFVLQGMLRDVAGGALSLAAEALGRAAATLPQLEALLEFRPSPRQRLREVRRALDKACRARIKASLAGVIGPAARIPLSLAERETLALDVRAFTQAARRIGEPANYDTIMIEATAQLSEPGQAGLSRPERARLIELLGEASPP